MKKDHNKFLLNQVCKKKLGLKKEDEPGGGEKKLIQVPLCGLMFALTLIVVMYCRLRLCHYVTGKIL
jgi:hypothetical protein